MNCDLALRIWWQNKVPIGALVELTGQDVPSVEDALRAALDAILAEHIQKQGTVTITEATFTPAEATLRNMAAIRQENAAAAMRRSAVRRKIAKESEALDLTGYPESLRDPKALNMRAVWDALRAKPLAFGELMAAAGINPDGSTAYGALSRMREKCLIHKRDFDGKWERTAEE